MMALLSRNVSTYAMLSSYDCYLMIIQPGTRKSLTNVKMGVPPIFRRRKPWRRLQA